MATLNELLAPQVLFKSVVNRVKKAGDTLQRHYGLQIGASGEDIPGRTGAYDIYDSVRVPSNMRAPNTGPARIAANPIAQQAVTCARFYESVPLYYDRIFPLRRMGGPASEVDSGGQDYIEHQKATMRERMASAREWMCAGMMRGSSQVLVSGDNWIPVYTGGTFTIDWLVPASNKTTLDMTGNGAIIANLWSDVVNADIFAQVMAIDAAFQQQHGWPLRHIWINGLIWSYVTNNAGLKARCGSSNMVIAENPAWMATAGVNTSDTVANEQVAEIRCLPGIKWHVFNAGLTINGTFTKFLADSGAASAVFTPEPDQAWIAPISGSEWIQENEVQPATERRGEYFYPTYYREPARIELTAWGLWLPALKVPKCMAIGSVA